MSRKKAVKPVQIRVPQNEKEAANFIAEIADAQRAVIGITNKLNEDVDRLKAEAMQEAERWQAHLEDLTVGLFAYAELNRDVLAKGGKTIKYPTGNLEWRLTPPSISLKKKDAVLVALKTLGLKRFIRVKEDVNKEAMLEEVEVAKQVPGVSVVQHENFVVKPSAIDVEIEKEVLDLRRRVVRKL